MKCLSLFSGKNNKNMISSSSLNIPIEWDRLKFDWTLRTGHALVKIKSYKIRVIHFAETLTHVCRMDSSTSTLWTDLFPI